MIAVCQSDKDFLPVTELVLGVKEIQKYSSLSSLSQELAEESKINVFYAFKQLTSKNFAIISTFISERPIYFAFRVAYGISTCFTHENEERCIGYDNY